MLWTGLLFALGSLALAGLPPITMFLGKGMIEDTATAVGYAWVTAVLVLSSILTGGSVLRVAGGAFLGWGAGASGGQHGEQPARYTGRTSTFVFLPPLVLKVAALVLGVIPGMGPAIEVATGRFQDHSAYAAVVLDGVTRHVPLPPLPPVGQTPSVVLAALASTAGTVAFVLLAFFWRRQYIHDNTEDEISHFTFLNAYLVARGADPVNLDRFRTLPSSKATGAQQIGRLTNLMQLTVDTSWWTRYRSRTRNPDAGDTFPQAVPGLSQGQFPAIPRDDNDLAPDNHIQAIANTAGFHFGFIEQGGSSLYPSLAQRVSSPEVLRILLSIGPTETAHFQTWHDKAGNAKVLTDPTNGLVFPDLNAAGSEDLQTNLIMPEPTVFLSRTFPVCSIIRPTQTKGAARGAVKALMDDGLFIGQSPAFFAVLRVLAAEADAARRDNGANGD